MNILNKARELIRRIIEGIYCALGLGMPVHYVNSGEALPPPLSKQEEAECIGALAAGDESMRRVLIERNLRLVVYIARKFENTGVNIEDLISIGAIGLIKAVNTFDAGKKIKLATYASRCIENEILMHLRRSSKLKMEVSLDEPLNIDWDGNELLLSDILGTDNDLVCRDIAEYCHEQAEPAGEAHNGTAFRPWRAQRADAEAGGGHDGNITKLHFPP